MEKIQRPIAAFDLDGTIFRGSLLDKLTERLCRTGFIPNVFAMHMVQLFIQQNERQIPYRLYEEKLVRLLLAALRGKKQSELIKIANLVMADAAGQTYSFTTTLLAQLRQTHDCIVVTAGMSETADDLAEYWGFQTCFSSVFEVKNGLYTGGVASTVAHDKGQTLKTRLTTANHTTLTGSIAIGDSRSDIPLLSEVEQPIAFNPDHELMNRAERERWPVVLEQKNVIYVLQ
ncbi:HAD-IB family phosphatase, partial [Patescibacteria group bacterium]|nr:HAD-IB family phosphatase [Patescibacteria group bacterium]